MAGDRKSSDDKPLICHRDLFRMFVLLLVLDVVDWSGGRRKGGGRLRVEDPENPHGRATTSFLPVF
jgi:hypothetical protein